MWKKLKEKNKISILEVILKIIKKMFKKILLFLIKTSLLHKVLFIKLSNKIYINLKII